MAHRNHSPKSRPVAALLILTATLFLLAGRSCGVVGALLSASVARLLGDAGTGLLVATAWTLAFIHATPPGTLTRMVVAVWKFATRPRPAAVVVVKRGSTNAETADDVVAAVRSLAGQSPRDRRELQAISDALKGLGFHRHEYEPIVAKMDPSVGFEKNVKAALKALQVN